MDIFTRLFSKKYKKVKYTCHFCAKKFEDGAVHTRIGESDIRACEACIPKMAAVKLCKAVHDEQREMTVDELRRYDASWQANGLEGMKKALKETSMSGTPYDGVTLDPAGLPVLTFTCPECSRKGVLKMDEPKFALDQCPIKTIAQAELYRMLKPQLGVSCGHCGAAVTLTK